MVVKKYLTTTQHGAIIGKTQQKRVTLYNLDVIISVGYRVKSQRGTQFHDVYHFGASLKDLGKRLFAFDLMGFSKMLIMSQVV